jgi:tRNA pseudouridine55 synthase
MVAVNEDLNYWEGALLLVNKPLKWTSFDVVNKIRYTLKFSKKKIKVGHAGTLDPLATGLLIICTGSFTKKINELQDLDKIYTGTICLGATTPSYDGETEVNETFPTAHITESAILNCAQSFLGKQEQLPPIHSAIRIDGERAYKMARKGEEVQMKMRSVELFDFKITAIEMPKVHFQVHCSKGTYIRSLAHDFGKRLNSGSYLSALERTAIGKYSLENAWNLEELIRHILAKKTELDLK